jgi:long-chain acyl-CoA synthetase
LLPNSLESLAVDRGTTWSGRSVIPISWHWKPEDVRYVIENAEASAFVAQACFSEAAAEGVPGVARFAVGGDIQGFRPWADVEGLEGGSYEKPLAGGIVQYTSGTTGRPKGSVALRYPSARRRPTSPMRGR